MESNKLFLKLNCINNNDKSETNYEIGKEIDNKINLLEDVVWELRNLATGTHIKKGNIKNVKHQLNLNRRNVTVDIGAKKILSQYKPVKVKEDKLKIISKESNLMILNEMISKFKGKTNFKKNDLFTDFVMKKTNMNTFLTGLEELEKKKMDRLSMFKNGLKFRKMIAIPNFNQPSQDINSILNISNNLSVDNGYKSEQKRNSNEAKNSLQNEFIFLNRFRKQKKMTDKEILTQFYGKFERSPEKQSIINSKGKTKMPSGKYSQIKSKIFNKSVASSPNSSIVMKRPLTTIRSSSSMPKLLDESSQMSGLLENKLKDAFDMKEDIGFTQLFHNFTRFHSKKKVKEMLKSDEEIRNENYYLEEIKEIFFQQNEDDQNPDKIEYINKPKNKDEFDKYMKTLRNDIIFKNRDILVEHFGIDLKKDTDLDFGFRKKKKENKFAIAEDNHLKLRRLTNVIALQEEKLRGRLDKAIKKK